MGKQNKQETAPEKEGAVLTPEVITDTETVIEEVIKDALDATNEAKANVGTDSEAKAKAEANAEAKKGFEYKGVLYNFVEETPAKLSLDEGLFTQEEILSNHELMQSLIEDNCIFIKQV